MLTLNILPFGKVSQNINSIKKKKQKMQCWFRHFIDASESDFSIGLNTLNTGQWKLYTIFIKTKLKSYQYSMNSIALSCKYNFIGGE